MVAPLGMRPTVGVLTITLEPSNPSAPRPPTTKEPCETAYASPSRPTNTVCNKVPPCKLCELPIEETVTSIFCPRFANAEISAWTATAATFFILGF